MLNKVLILAFVAVASAAPQFPFFHPYPVYSPYMTVPGLRSPYQPHFMPYPISYISQYNHAVQEPKPLVTTRIGGEVAQPPAPVETPVFTNEDNSISLELAEKLLTPEQLRLLEETVAAMNPLEYAARLEITKDPEEAIRLFKKSRNPPKN